MTINKYYDDLESCLKRLSEDEKEDAINFYKEYAMEAGITKYNQMVEYFGTPQSLSAQIYAESATKQVSDKCNKKNKVTKGLIFAIAGIFMLPFSFPIFIVLLSVGFAFIVSSLAIIFSIGVTLFVLGGTGITLFIKSFGFLIPFLPILWLKSLGGSLILISITGLITFLLFIGIRYIIKLVTIALTKIIKIRGKNE